jgi:uncharacterized protein (UPF0276 family)
MTASERPDLGFGLGLRTEHYEAMLQSRPPIDWLEAITENYMVDGGKPLHYLDRFRADYPMVLHGVSMSIGGSDPLDDAYLDRLAQLIDRIEPRWISDHLCWTGHRGINMHDLLPLPQTEEAVKHVAERVLRVQDRLKRRLLLENVSSYVSYGHSAMPEWEFLSAIAARADCLILLDINNIFVSAYNHEFDPLRYLDGIDRRRVRQFHLAGHRNHTSHIVDTHDQPIVQGVWDLFAEAWRRFGPVSTMIERDAEIPPLDELVAELDQARRIAAGIRQESVA